jgi:hypothetical protein
MAVTFYGVGLCYIPTCHRCIQFVDGEYTTEDEEEMAVLALSYEHKSDITLDVTCSGDVTVTKIDDEPVKPKRGRPRNEN